MRRHLPFFVLSLALRDACVPTVNTCMHDTLPIKYY
jgi:hypothetical protein